MVESVNGVHNVERNTSTESVAAGKKPQSNNNVPVVNKQEAAKRNAASNLRRLANSGQAEYVDTNVLENIISFIFDHRAGDFVRIKLGNNGGKKMTFGEAKQRMKLNLPAGSLRHNDIDGGGGDFDRHSVPRDKSGNYYVDVFITDLEKGTGLSKDDIKSICPEAK